MDRESPVARFLRYARLCRTRDLEQLVILGELIKGLSELIHALQKERGTSAIFLGSGGAQFADRLAARMEECRMLERVVRERMEQIDQKLDHMIFAARFYTRVAFAFRALDTLTGTREEVASLRMAPQDAVKAFTEIIGGLLSVCFEVADIPVDPEVSRALVALVHFSQAKEYAGQERAIAGAALSCGCFHAADQRRLQHLVAAQEQAIGVSLEFAGLTHVTAIREVLTGPDSTEVKRIRKILRSVNRHGDAMSVAADTWYQYTTRRIDAMKTIEDQMASDLAHLCVVKLPAVSSVPESPATDQIIDAVAPVAMLVTDVDPALNPGLRAGISLYTLAGPQPKPMRSILDVIQAQSRHLHAMSGQLESARVALVERKAIDRAKGLLMNSRRLSEADAYALMRQTAMSQNKRIVEIAESVVSMAEMLKK